ncbi:hypothetical protein [Catenulispora subtropica]|uniref:Integrase n=1 Tax=Catenulispora subtropica TaxID=450798 RepID=A0ABN2QWJ8_9ACTN
MTAPLIYVPASELAGYQQIPSHLAARSPFSGADVCALAGLAVAPGGHRSRFDDDLWDFVDLADAPRMMRPSEKRWDFGHIPNPRWRLTAKEFLMALLAPEHEAVVALPHALRTPMNPTTLRIVLRELGHWLSFLGSAGVESLAEVMQEHCDAYRQFRTEVGLKTARRPRTAPVTPGGLIVTLKPVKYLSFYTELFTAGGYAAGFEPWKGKTVSQVVGWKPPASNTTPAVPDELFQPLMAAALYLMDTLGEPVAQEFSQVKYWLAHPGTGPSTVSAQKLGLIRAEIDRYAAEGIPLARSSAQQVKNRLTQGWSPDDPLLKVNYGRLMRGVTNFSFLQPKDMAKVRPALQAAVEAVGLAEPYGRDPALIPTYDTGDLVPWTAQPLSSADVRQLAYMVNAACRIVVSAISGMRSSEMDELTDTSPLPPVDVPGGTQRYRLASKLIKHKAFGGIREEWVVLEPAWKAVKMASRLARDDYGAHAFSPGDMSGAIEAVRRFVNSEAGARLGLAPIPDGPITTQMLRQTLAMEMSQRPGGLLAAKIHLKHLRVATTEGYSNRPGGSQAALLAEVRKAEQKHHLELTAQAFRDFQAGQLPAGPGARDLIAAFEHIDEQLKDFAAGEPSVLESERRLENLLRQQSKHLHVQAANYCWFRDPGKALCLKLAGRTGESRPLAGMCDSARCPQATHHPCHKPVWLSAAGNTQSLIDNPRIGKAERLRLVPERDRALAVVADIDSAHPGP